MFKLNLGAYRVLTSFTFVMTDSLPSDEATSTTAPSTATTTAMLDSASTPDATTTETVANEPHVEPEPATDENTNAPPVPPPTQAVASAPPLTLSFSEPARPVSASPASYAPPNPRAPIASTSQHHGNGLRAPLMGNTSSTPIPPSLQARLAAVRFSPSTCEIDRSITCCCVYNFAPIPVSRYPFAHSTFFF